MYISPDFQQYNIDLKYSYIRSSDMRARYIIPMKLYPCIKFPSKENVQAPTIRLSGNNILFRVKMQINPSPRPMPDIVHSYRDSVNTNLIDKLSIKHQPLLSASRSDCKSFHSTDVKIATIDNVIRFVREVVRRHVHGAGQLAPTLNPRPVLYNQSVTNEQDVR